MNRGRLKKIILVAVVIYIIWKFLSGLIGGADLRGGKYLTNRPWIENVPKNERAMTHAFFLLDKGKRHFGSVAYGSMYRVTLDTVEWKTEGDELTLNFLQEQTRAKFKVRTWECAGQAPEPFDLCL